jgi:zinc protease
MRGRGIGRAGLIGAVAVVVCGSIGGAQGVHGAARTDVLCGAPATVCLGAMPIEYTHLANGLKVVLAPDTMTPVVVVAVYYNVGHRTEGHGQEGFAHLFEHLMFEGSTHLGPGELLHLIQRNGGTLNGNTRFDFTDYFEIVPPAALQLMLWAEADRMGGLVVDDSALRRQKDIVKSEVRLSYINRADGGFPWLDVPQVANRNWQNAHNFRGLPAQLDSATLDEVRRFHQTYYVPNNAVLVLSGNFRPSDVRGWINAYFGRISRGADFIRPDATEPQQTSERRGERVDSLASRPVLAVAYHMPPRNTRAFWAMAVIDQLVLQGDDAWIPRAVVRDAGLADAVSGGANVLGNMFDYQASMLWTVAVNFDRLGAQSGIVDSIQAALDRLRTQAVSRGTLRVAQQKARSAFYDILDERSGFGRADLLASLALFDDHPAAINTMESSFDAITPDDIMTTARDYLDSADRTVYLRRPATDAATGASR